jgi:hypothetical protein
MRIANAILVGAIAAALAGLTSPMLAKNSEAQKTDDKSISTASPCHAYQAMPDGEMKPIPCAEGPEGARTQHRPAAGSADEATH